jgi:large subunit ribosomal protein L24
MSRLKKGDEVVVIAGRDKGKRGLVLKVDRGANRVIVENINLRKRHTKGNPMRNAPGGIIEKERPLAISNVAVWNPVTGKPDRIGYRFLEDGRKVRFLRSNDEVLDT